MASTGTVRILVATLLVISVTLCECQEMCQSMFGGQVYPHETCGPQSGQRTLGHSLQWSQAISAYLFTPHPLNFTVNTNTSIVTTYIIVS